MSEQAEKRTEETGTEGAGSRGERWDPKGTKAKKRKRIFRRIIVTLLLLVLLGGAGLYTWAKLKDEYTVTYDSYTATTGTISNALSFSGNLALIDSASCYAEDEGKVRAVYVKAGDEVKKGDRLIRLSNGESYTADFDGKVNVVNFEEGDEVSRDDLLVQIADFSRMEVSFRVDEYDISDVQVGDACTITATATEKTFQSNVKSINYISSSSGNVAYYTAQARVNVDEGVYPGMQVTVTIPQEEAANVVVLKLDALSFSRENKAFVYVMGEDGKMKENPVEVGVSNGNYVEIKSGVKDGDTVYAEAKDDSMSTMASLFSGMFGSQQVNNRQNRQNMQRNSENSGFGGGNGPSGTRNGGSGSSGGGSSGNGTGGGR